MTNTASIVGRVVQDARLMMARNGAAVALFSVAVNDRRVDRATGELREFVSYIDCVVFGKRAEALAPYITRGKLVGITGPLRQARWTTDDGRRRSRVSIVAQNIDLLSPKRPVEVAAEVTA